MNTTEMVHSMVHYKKTGHPARLPLTVKDPSLVPDGHFPDSVFARPGLHILHLNVRSLVKKMDEIRLLFSISKIVIL